MSAAAQTKVFGIRLGVDPKILVGGLIGLAVLLFWLNSRGGEETAPTPTPAVRQSVPNVTVPAVPRTHAPVSRRAVASNDRGTLRLRPIDATKGDIDPTLRLDLLARLQSVQLDTSGRSLFELGPAPLTPAQQAVIANAPKITPRPLPGAPGVPGPGGQPGAPMPVMANIPLKYYGYTKPDGVGLGALGQNKAAQASRGFFLDGDNILVGSEGEMLKQRYLIVQLTPTSARLEDTQIKQGQTLPVVPAAVTTP